MSKELQKAESKSPAEIITAVMASGATPDQLEKMLSMQERWEANEARKAYAMAFSQAQKKIGVVVKTKTNKQTNSKYADLKDIIEMAKPVYTENGFSVIFYEGKTEQAECIRVCADVLHELGHKESFFYDVPLDGVGIKGNANMTKIHGKASSTSYGQRYLMCMIWNIPTGDDDGNAGGKKETPITEEEMNILNDWMLSANRSEQQVCNTFKIGSFKDMNRPLYVRIIAGLKATVEKAKAGK